MPYLFIKNFKHKKEGLRLLALLLFVFILSYLLISLAQLEPIQFSLKTGEFKCDKIEDCIEMAKEKSLSNFSEQIQIKKAEFKRITSILRWFAFVPLEYEVNVKNLSYLIFSVTGTDFNKRINDGVIINCKIGNKPFDLQYGDNIPIFDKLEFDDFQENLFNQFDGCNFVSAGAAVRGPFIWPSGEYIKLTFERDLQFVPRLVGISKLLIIIQVIILVLIALPVFRQAGLFINKGRNYFFKN